MPSKSRIILILVVFFLRCSSSDLEQDRTECSNQLAGLATCLPYVGGQAKAPTKDCCDGLKEVLEKSQKCICILIKDRNDPKLGLNINATLAVHLPVACHQSAPNISQCISLLHIPSNSTEAKEFEDLGKMEGNATALPSPGHGPSVPVAASEKSDGGKSKGLLAVETITYGGLMASSFASYIIHL